MKLPSKVKFGNENVRDAFYRLEEGDFFEKELIKWIKNAFIKIEQDAFCGIQLQKRLIPNYYIEKYKVTNLWKFNLPDGWRLIYSVVNDKVIIISLILEWLEHKDYERKFKY